MKNIKDLNLENKKVIIRCDFNVPIKEGKIIDDTRIVASLQTINYCLEHHAKIILMSHLGRVKEESDLAKNDLAPVAVRLAELLNRPVKFIPQTRGSALEEAIATMNPQDIILMQNTRYEDLEGKKESSNDEELGKYWASLGDIFINDAFGTAHRAHASNVGIATHLPSAPGFLIEKELTALNSLNDPEHPFIVILGGAKVSDKIGVIANLVKKADKIIIGGGMAFTFLKAQGYETGTSLIDSDSLEFCTNILKEYANKIILPIDVAITTEFTEKEEYKVKPINDILQNEMGLDIGPKTLELFEENLKDAKIVVWNGPLGVYEFSKYKVGTDKLLAYLVNNNIKTILGGGDIVAAANNYKEQVYHASTGGGATLEYLEGKILPGIEVLK
ncbi:MAG: phosphoglycerate kinase [bacterium]|nr:phosphoglycerate kinase [bacterium]